MPKESRSVRASKGLPSTCSGDMYAAVPRVDPGLVRWSLPDRVFAAAMRLDEGEGIVDVQVCAYAGARETQGTDSPDGHAATQRKER